MIPTKKKLNVSDNKWTSSSCSCTQCSHRFCLTAFVIALIVVVVDKDQREIGRRHIRVVVDEVGQFAKVSNARRHVPSVAEFGHHS